MNERLRREGCSGDDRMMYRLRDVTDGGMMMMMMMSFF